MANNVDEIARDIISTARSTEEVYYYYLNVALLWMWKLYLTSLIMVIYYNEILQREQKHFLQGISS